MEHAATAVVLTASLAATALCALRYYLVRREQEELFTNKLLNSVLEQMIGGVIAINAEGKIVVFNRGAEEITGIPASRALGRHITEVPAEDTALVAFQVLQGKAPVGHMEVQRKIKGKNLWILISADLLRDKQGRVEGAVTIFHDITELKRQRDLQYNQEKLAVAGQMAASIAHELRNPLTSIRGFAQLLGDRLKDEKDREYLEVIIQEIDRANEIIRNFLLLTRPAQEKRQHIDLNTILRELLPLIESQCILARVELHLDLDPGLPEVVAHPDQIKQVLLNLIHNALQAMEGQRTKKLTLTTRWLPATGEVLFSVADTGHGMPEEVILQLGTPFFTTKETGTGLGLTITYRIVESHGGRIEVSSRQGLGSEFRVYFPAKSPNS
ncbi:two-component system sensor histidine kinase NtrB [Desulfovirgula thermocuniculi]|uniref:two-component system sensor histidine kinase NtrB n=1 Tax=Desulfovirgula thermocuniculi TaxID=348842 RepID=UPI000409ADC9|nr:ATP-binding protein [Desulfovirgula thermocuniculi]